MNTQLVFLQLVPSKPSKIILKSISYHSWQMHVLSGSMMDIKSFWTEHQNFEMFTFHWEVSVSAEVRNPLQSNTGIKPSAAMKPIMAEGLTPCTDRSLHRAEKCGQSRGHKPDSSQKRYQQGLLQWFFRSCNYSFCQPGVLRHMIGKWWQVRSGKDRIASKGTHEAPFAVCSEP